jgi:hypothetical protein
MMSFVKGGKGKVHAAGVDDHPTKPIDQKELRRGLAE